MRSGRAFLLALGLAAAGCAEVQFLAQGAKDISGSADGPVEGGRYVVGNAWRAGAVYYYPSEDFTLDQTGLAVVYDGPPRRGRFSPRTTANDETFDARRLTAAHQTLQLPAIARVTNLDTGRGVVVRINDRGPAEPGRIIALSPAAAAAVGIVANQPARVRVQVLETESRRLANTLKRADEPIQLAAAPAPGTRAVASEMLAPPPGTRAAATVRSAPPGVTPVGSAGAGDGPVVRVGTRSQEPVRATQLAVQAGTFAEPRNAGSFAARLQGIVPGRVRTDAVSSGGRYLYRVRIGPITGTAEADRILAQARAAGAPDARIVVE
jgi:rare lipoprotein A